MSSETKHMRLAIRYLIVRDTLLFGLIGSHLLFYYNLITNLSTSVFWALMGGAIVWAIYHVKSTNTYYRMRNDLQDIYHDEYMKNIMLKANYHGYVSVFILCLALIAISVLSNVLTITIDIPYYIACEIIILIAIITNDVSKIIGLSR